MIHINGSYDVVSRRTFIGWLAKYEFTKVGGITVEPDYAWWRPTRGWAESAVWRRIRRWERDGWA